jgi:hypothetical protein
MHKEFLEWTGPLLWYIQMLNPHYHAMHGHSNSELGFASINWSKQKYTTPFAYKPFFRAFCRLCSEWISCYGNRKLSVFLFWTHLHTMCSLHTQVQELPKIYSHLIILSARRTTCSKFHTTDPQMLGTTISNLVVPETRNLCTPD